MKTRNIILAGFLFSLCAGAFSQVTENHVGVRAGIISGVYYQRMSEAGTAENSFYMLLSASSNSARFTAMRIVYESTLGEISNNLFFTWGYGGHIGFAITDHAYFLGKRYQFEYERFRPLAGIDGWAGIEYRFASVPLALGVNIKPYIEIMMPGFIKLQPGDVGLSFAYTF